MISVIVPVYNVEKYLEKCIDSLLNQDYLDYEILLIDDGSRDSCPKICDDYASRFNIIHTFHKENGGLSSARNFGVTKARGEFVTFVDSDDYVCESYLSDLDNLRKKFDADMAITRVAVQTEEEALMEYNNKFEDFVLTNKDAFFEVYVNDRVGWSGCGKLFPKILIENIPFPSGYYEEMASTYLYLDACSKIAIGDYGNNYHYIRREGSITDCPINASHYRIFEVCKEIEDFVLKKYPEEHYATVLLYQNAVLQLLTKLQIDNKTYDSIFIKYRKIFRKSLIEMLTNKKVVNKSKYYALILCTTPGIFRMQRKVFNIIKKG